MNEALSFLSYKDPQLSKLIKLVGQLEIKVYDDPFRFIVGEIVGQMISNKVKKIIISRLIQLCDNNICPEVISTLSVRQLREIGLSNAKSTYIIGLANEVNEGKLNLASLISMSDEEVIIHLMKVIGIGVWTAKMFLLFAMQRPNILPIEDIAFIQGFNWLYDKRCTNKNFIIKKAKNWQPYCSIAARYIYECVNRDFIKQDVNRILNGLE